MLGVDDVPALAGLDVDDAAEAEPLAAGGRAGRRWGAVVDGVDVVPTGPLLLLGLDAIVMRQSPPLGTMWKLAVCRWERAWSSGRLSNFLVKSSA